MRARRAYYMRWADDSTKAEWLGSCPKWIEAMRRSSSKSGRKLIETPVRFLRPKVAFCAECQKFTSH